MNEPKQSYHPLTTVAFAGAVLLFMLPGQAVLVLTAVKSYHFIQAILIVVICTSIVLVPLIYASIQTKKRPERWKPRFLTKVIWGFVMVNIFFDCMTFFDLSLWRKIYYICDRHPESIPTSTRTQIAEIEKATQIYSMQHNGKFPNSIEDLVTGTEDHPGLLKKGNIIDNWGMPYGYSRIGKKIRISSAGPDRKMGTEDDMTN
jgi:hypothetical protein